MRIGGNMPETRARTVAMSPLLRNVGCGASRSGSDQLSKGRGDIVSVNRTDLVAAIADKAGLTKTDADKALGALQEVLVESLGKGEAVKVTGLLSVERVERKARTGRNPRTGEEIKIPAGFGVKVSAGSVLKKAVG